MEAPLDQPETVTSSWAPRPWLAGLLALIAWGVGHLYAGRPRRAAAVVGLSLAAGAIVVTAVVRVPGRATIIALYLVLLVSPTASVVDAWRVARRQKALPKRLYQRWFTIAVAVLVSGFVIQPALLDFARRQFVHAYTIPSITMAPTLLEGDFILTTPLRDVVARGELVVHSRETGTFVMRAVGVPGDTLAMRGGRLVVNGQPTTEPYALGASDDPAAPEFTWQREHLVASADTTSYRPSAQSWGPLVVPPGHYFMLGDNRGASLDSRYVGFVPASALLGRTSVIYFSRDTSGAVRWSRIGQAVR